MKKILLTFIIMLSTIILAAQIITPEVEMRAEQLLRQMTLEEKINYIGGYNDFYLRAIPRLGIPMIRMADGPQGVRNDTHSTMYACGITSAASWNRNLIEKMGNGLGLDCRARGVHFILGPGVNIYRSPLCGRNFEYFGEDPYLASEIAVAYVKGVQSKGVIATAKHFAGNNQEWDRYSTSSEIDDRTLNEIYLKTFQKVIQKANIGAIMNSYNELNGTHTSENSYLNIDILRNKWGFKGILMSDWGSVSSGVGAANSGTDLEMPSGEYMNQQNIMQAINNGTVDKRTIDEKIRHILQTEIAFGFLDRDQLDKSIPENNKFSDSIALEVARQGIVMVKNQNNTLPVKGKNIVITGPNANIIPAGGGSGFVHPIISVTTEQGFNQLGKKYKITNIQSQPAVIDKSKYFFTDTSCTTNGFTTDYFNNDSLQGTPVVHTIENAIHFDWKTLSPKEGIDSDYFSVRCTATYMSPMSEEFVIIVSGDDGYRLFIDGEQVISDWDAHATTIKSYLFKTEANRKYDFRMEFFEVTGNASLTFECAHNVDWNIYKKVLNEADVIVYCGGLNSMYEGEGFDRPFEIPEEQISNIQKLADYNKNIVLVLNSGGGVDFSRIEPYASSILIAWYPGQEGGKAISEIITGKVVPSGKLPISIEKKLDDNPSYKYYYGNSKSEAVLVRGRRVRIPYTEGLFVGYRGYDKSEIKPLYPFGFGMSYSTFEYSNLQIKQQNGYNVTVSFDIKNTGNYDAAEIAELYVNDVQSSVVRPKKELKGFEKVFLKRNEIKTVTIQLDEEAFSYYDVITKTFVVENGQFNIMVGSSSADIKLNKSVNINL